MKSRHLFSQQREYSLVERFCNRWSMFCLLLAGILASPLLFAQQPPNEPGTLQGQISDTSGAIIPQASVTITTQVGNISESTVSNGLGIYEARGLSPGYYIVTITAKGFSVFSKAVKILPSKVVRLNAELGIKATEEAVSVRANQKTTDIDTTPDTNASAIVLKGKALDSFSDDPDELKAELEVLAGSSAGPGGSQIYIDGFTGGQVPPKSDIREVRINQNPFSAAFDRLGYGRIEILTKPGTAKLHGSIFSRGNYSAFNAQNPILNANLPPGSASLQEPSYYSYFLNGNIGGPLTKSSSYFVSAFGRNVQNVNIVDAVDPASVTSSSPNGVVFNQSLGNPSSRLDASIRFDYQLGASNVITVRYAFFRFLNTDSGPGQTSLNTQASNIDNEENTLQVSDNLVLSKKFVDDIRFQYRRIRNSQIAQFTSPTVTLQGDFIAGGSNAGTSRDNQDDYEIQNYFTGSKGDHSLNFGTRFRVYRDANFTDGGTNGFYVFPNAQSYLNRAPRQYKVTVVNNNQYTARAIVFDGALFYQDDWKIRPQLTLSYGMRWETQNYISDKSDWAPRVYLAYALDGDHGQNPRTVLRAGYGWFYQRFTVPMSSISLAGTPYVIQTIHNNLPSNPSIPSNQQIYIETHPSYAESSPGNPIKPPTPTSPSTALTFSTTDPNFHAALDMQGSIGVDRQIVRNLTGNATYLFSRGIHQYLTNNVTAPYFNSSSNTYPDIPLTPPSTNIYEYQSGGVYRESQVAVTLTARMRRLSINSTYTYTSAKGDTTGVSHFPSNAHNPAADYGRMPFDIANRFALMGTFTGPRGLMISPYFVYNSGVPYNIKIGNDLTANNQFNARPTFASSCAEAGVIPTIYGCLNPNPAGTNEQIVPYGLGTGPSNTSLNLHVSKTIGFGPKRNGSRGSGNGGKSSTMGGQGNGDTGSGAEGQGNGGGMGRMYGTTNHRYALTFSAYTTNVFNTQNLGVPNGTLTSKFFGRSQSLAGGFFGPPSAGNRSIFLQSSLNF